MQFAESRNEFVTLVTEGPVWTEVRVPELSDFMNALSDKLKANAHDGSQITNLIWRNLRAMCSECCCHISGEVLGDLQFTANFGRERTTFYGNGPVSRLLDGVCPNADCTSKKLRLIWEGCQHFADLLQEHIARIRTDAERERDDARVHCLNVITEPQALSYAIDSLWGLTLTSRESRNQLLHTNREFSSQCIWTTTVQGPLEGAKNLFPSGYLRFLNRILHQSGYTEENKVFAHWIYTFQATSEGIRGTIHLALFPGYSTPKAEQFKIIPGDLLTTSEKAEIGMV